MKYITILDFSNGEVHIIPHDFPTEDFSEIAEIILEERGIKFKESECEWMIQNSLKLQIH